MSRFILLSLALGTITSFAGCGSDDSSSGGGSGVTGGAQLGDLSAAERDDLCNYIFDASGAPRSATCDGFTVRTATVAECIDSLEGVSASCTAIVSDAEHCAEAIGDNFCDALESPDCDWLFSCAGSVSFLH